MAFRNVMKLRRSHVALLAGVPMVSYTVYAAEDGSSTRRVPINQLPVYGNPEDRNKYEFVEEKITPFRESISSVRKTVWTYLDSIQETRDYVQDIYQTGKAHTLGFVGYIQSDPGILPRVGVITVAGLGGIVAGYRGGILRKLTYSSVAMAAAASLCYPNKAVELSTAAYDTVAMETKTWWSAITGQESSSVPPVSSKSEEVPVKKPDPGIMKKIEEIETHVLQKPSKTVEDFGQSKQEDKDLYTTRS